MVCVVLSWLICILIAVNSSSLGMKSVDAVRKFWLMKPIANTWQRFFSKKLETEDILFATTSLPPIKSSLQTKTRVNTVIKSKFPYISRFRRGVQVDCQSVDQIFTNQLSTDNTQFRDHKENNSFQFDMSDFPVEIQNGIYSKELSIGIKLVARTSYLSRSLQQILLSVKSSDCEKVIKIDNSPVTVADFACQALILEELHKHFPGDLFIAEENSAFLRNNEYVRKNVIEALMAATGEEWSDDRLFTAVDLGETCAHHDQHAKIPPALGRNRVWVLDPVDGTKGFLRGQHYCVALALLEDGVPRISVIGSPNFDSRMFLQRDHSSKNWALSSADMAASLECCDDEYSNYWKVPGIDTSNNGASITPWRHQQDIHVFPPHVGTLFCATLGGGTYCLPLSGSSSELLANRRLFVQNVSDVRDLIFCESAEASHGDRRTSQAVINLLHIKAPFLRVDGQCKHCLISAGAAHVCMRLPPSNYREKIWDLLPGALLVSEAGGRVTDLNGQHIVYSHDKHLSSHVTGVVTSCGGEGLKNVHQLVLDNIKAAKVNVAQPQQIPIVTP